MGQTPINSCAIPTLPIHAGALEAAAGKLKTSAGSVRTHGAGVKSSWAGLAGVYHAPESATLLAAMDPVATNTDAFAGDTEQVASILSTFAAEAGPLAATMASTKSDAMTFEGQANGTDDWDKHGDLVNKNNDLVHAVNTTLVAYQAAERKAANAIETLIGGHSFHVVDLHKKHQDKYAYGFSSIPDDAKLPWGSKAKKRDGCFASTMTHVGHFFKGIGEGAWGMVKGLGLFVWNGLGFGGWEKFKQQWTSLGQLGVIGLVTLGPKEWARRNLAVMKAMVHWDDWKKDPSKAAGETIFDVVTIAGTGGGAAVAKGGATASKVAKVTEVAEDAGKAGSTTSKIAKAGELTKTALQTLSKYADPATYLRNLGKIPRISDVLAGLKTKLGDLHGLGGAGHDIDHATAGWGDKHLDIDNKIAHPDTATSHVGESSTMHDHGGSQRVTEHAGVGAGGRSVDHVPPGTAHGGGGDHVPPRAGGHAGGDGSPGSADRDGSGVSGAGHHPAGSAADPGKSATHPPVAHDVTITHDKPTTAFAARPDLTPHTAYHVEGRGTFYTDDTGRVTYVETSAGRTGALNGDLLHPQPDVTYVVDGRYVYHTDHLARTDHVHVDELQRADADRSAAIQRRIGHGGGGGYEGGHLIANVFGGGPEDHNLVAMLRDVNRGSGHSFGNLEKDWLARMKADPSTKITVDIRPHYIGDATTPSKVIVRYQIDGGRIRVKEFDNGGG